MTDRELLELTVLAAGLTVNTRMQKEREEAGFSHVGLWLVEHTCWNPLNNNDQAFMLLAKLRLNIIQSAVDVNQDFVTATHCSNPWPAEVERFDNEAMRPEAMRRAIVRAAAMIGKHMQEQAKLIDPPAVYPLRPE